MGVPRPAQVKCRSVFVEVANTGCCGKDDNCRLKQLKRSLLEIVEQIYPSPFPSSPSGLEGWKEQSNIFGEDQQEKAKARHMPGDQSRISIYQYNFKN